MRIVFKQVWALSCASAVSACMGLAKMYRQNLLNRSVVSYARQPIKEQIALYTMHFAQQTFL
jgi:hypothetical protein